MPRELRSVRNGFEWPKDKPWPGFLLDPVNCFVCDGTGKRADSYGYCELCEGEGKVFPKVDIPSFDHMKTFYPKDSEWVAEAITHGYKFQIWETTTEGSPITGLHDTPEEAWIAAGYKETNNER